MDSVPPLSWSESEMNLSGLAWALGSRLLGFQQRNSKLLGNERVSSGADILQLRKLLTAVKIHATPETPTFLPPCLWNTFADFAPPLFFLSIARLIATSVAIQFVLLWAPLLSVNPEILEGNKRRGMAEALMNVWYLVGRMPRLYCQHPKMAFKKTFKYF